MRDDGVVFICNLTNIAENGDMPHEVLTIVSKHWFEQRTIGVSRSYQAKGVNERIDMLIRIELNNDIHIGQYAVLGNGDQFRIDMVTPVEDVFERTKMMDSKYYRQPKIVGLTCTAITMSRLENYYDVQTN